MPTPAGRTGIPSSAEQSPNGTSPTPRRRRQRRRWALRASLTTVSAVAKTRGFPPGPVNSMPTLAGRTGTPSSAKQSANDIGATPRPRLQRRRWALRTSQTTVSATGKTHGCLATPISSMPTLAGRTGTPFWAMRSPIGIPPIPRLKQQRRR
ncbi:hypothetical protein FQZ97_606480 [compost metagenome]